MHGSESGTSPRTGTGTGVSETSTVVFEAQREPPLLAKPDFVRFEPCIEDDDILYPVPDSQPVLLTCNKNLFASPSSFDGFVSKAPATILVDSGASASSATLQWCQQHNIILKPIKSSGRLPNQSTFNIVDQLTRCCLKLRSLITLVRSRNIQARLGVPSVHQDPRYYLGFWASCMRLRA